MRQKKNQTRRKVVSDEPMFVEPGMLDIPLAPFWRRGGAFVVDIVIWFIGAMLFMMTLTFVLLYFNYPAIYETTTGHLFGKEQSGSEKTDREKLWKELIRLYAERKPEDISPELQKALEEGDDEKLSKILDNYLFNIDLDFSGNKESNINYNEKVITIRPGLLFGRLFMALNLGILFIGYFTFFTRLLKGYTLGKWLFRIRVSRLDGRPLSWWDSFGRAAGYSASLSMLGLGFIEAFWHPNRQTVHDRISNTVVIKARQHAKHLT